MPRTTAPPRSTAPPRTTAPRSTAPQGVPTVGPRSVVALETNPLLQDPNAGLPNLVCTLPAWQTSPAAAERFFRASATCLHTAWEPLLQYYGMPTAAPRLEFPRGTSVNSPCGAQEIGIQRAAFYCRGTIYVPFAGLQTDLYGDDPGVYLALFAHEYGHHVQAQSGILAAFDARTEAVGSSSAAGLDVSRRLELQAQCFSGMFLGSHVERGGTITQAMFDRAWQDQETRGDQTSGTHDHGSNAHYAGWWRAGATKNRTAQCNTFAATAGDVS